MKRRSLFLILLIAVAQTGWSQNTETRTFSDFSEVSVGESIELILIKGSENKASIETDGIDTEDVETDVRGSRLVIGIRNNNKWWKNTKVKVALTYTSLSEIDVSSSATVKNEGTIKADRLAVEVSSSGTAELVLDVKDLEVEVSSSGRLSVSGTNVTQDIEVSSSGTYNSFDLNSEVCTAEVSSSGRAKISVSKDLRANASSSGSISYRGDPDKLIVNSNSSGRVSKS